MTNTQIANHLWQLFHAREFAKAKPLLHGNFECVWPQSKERIVGADNFIALNENYPGEWSIDVKRIVDAGDTVVSEVELTSGDQKVFAVSFFEFSDGKIIRATEYWSEPYEPPANRSQWTENL